MKNGTRTCGKYAASETDEERYMHAKCMAETLDKGLSGNRKAWRRDTMVAGYM